MCWLLGSHAEEPHYRITALQRDSSEVPALSVAEGHCAKSKGAIPRIQGKAGSPTSEVAKPTG